MEHAAEHDVGDREPPADDVLAVAELLRERRCDLRHPLAAGRDRLLVLPVARSAPAHHRPFELGHREEDPLVGLCALAGAERCDQVRLGVRVGDVHAERRGLEQQPFVGLQHGNPPERVPFGVLGAVAFVLVHNDVFVGNARFFERPADAGRAPGALSLIEAQQGDHSSAYSVRSCFLSK